MKHLECSTLSLALELSAFVMHITGKLVVVKKSIQVEFMDGDDAGAIVAHTCSSQIVFPRGAFSDTEESFQTFTMALKAVVAVSVESPLSFNLV